MKKEGGGGGGRGKKVEEVSQLQEAKVVICKIHKQNNNTSIPQNYHCFNALISYDIQF